MTTTEQQEHEERNAALAAVAHALTAEERALFLGNAVRLFPHMEGADVADVLDCTTDHDEFLHMTEPFLERFAGQLPQDVRLSAAMHAVLLLGQELTPGRVTALLQRAGLADAPRYPDVKVGVRSLQGKDVGHLMVMGSAEQQMRAAGVPEAEITEFRTSVRETGVSGFSRNIADIAKWVTLVDGYIPPPRAWYDPTHDLAVVLATAAKLAGWAAEPEAAAALGNLKAHLDTRAAETIEADLRGFYGKEG
jgi:hypothetical protein